MHPPSFTSRNIAIGTSALISVLLLIATAAVSTSEAAKLKTRTVTVSTAATGPAGGKVVCPKGTSVIGGGFRQGTFLAPGDGDFVIAAISRRAGKRSWVFVGNRQDTGPAGPALSLSVHAYCRKIAKKLVVRRASTLMTPPVGPGFGAVAVTAKCPKGMKSVAGGFTVGDPGYSVGAVWFWGNHKAGKRGWTVNAAPISFTANQPHTIISEAYCAKTSVSQLSGSIAAPPANDTVRTATTPGCAAPKAPGAGGFLSTPPDGGGYIGLPLASFRKKSAWVSSVVNRGPGPGTHSAFALCS